MLYVTCDIRLINLFILNIDEVFNIISIFDLNLISYNLLVLSCVNNVEYMIKKE